MSTFNKSFVIANLMTHTEKNKVIPYRSHGNKWYRLPLLVEQ